MLETIFYILTQQENIREGNFYFAKYSISVFQISVYTIGKSLLSTK